MVESSADAERGPIGEVCAGKSNQRINWRTATGGPELALRFIPKRECGVGLLLCCEGASNALRYRGISKTLKPCPLPIRIDLKEHILVFIRADQVN